MKRIYRMSSSRHNSGTISLTILQMYWFCSSDENVMVTSLSFWNVKNVNTSEIT